MALTGTQKWLIGGGVAFIAWRMGWIAQVVGKVFPGVATSPVLGYTPPKSPAPLKPNQTTAQGNEVVQYVAAGTQAATALATLLKDLFKLGGENRYEGATRNTGSWSPSQPGALDDEPPEGWVTPDWDA